VNRTTLAPDEWQRFQELLPWYANRTLGAAERREMDRWITASADCRAEFMEVMALAWQIQNEKVSVDERAGLDKLMAMVRARDAGKLLSLPASQPRELPRGESPRFASRWYKPVLAVAAAFALIQAGAILLFQLPEEAPSIVRPLGVPALSVSSTLLQTTFHAEATDAEIRSLFAKVGAEVISGPGALGIYTVKVPAATADAALAELRAARGTVDIAIILTN
jgi:hypothetical protein